MQAEIKRRSGEKTRHSGVGIFSSKIQCGECGDWYGSKVWHSTDQYRRVIDQCNHKYDGNKKCGTPHIPEDEMKNLFVAAVNRLLTERDELMESIGMIRHALCDNTGFEREQEEARPEISDADEGQ